MARPKTLQKQQAKYLYFTTARTQREIAKAIGVTPKALSHWVNKEGWAEEKKKAYYSPEQILHQLYEQLRVINENILKRKDGERYGTKEEIEASTKILALITNTIKNTPDSWRNIAPEYDITITTEPKEEEEALELTIGKEGKYIGSIKAGEIPMGNKQPDGTYKFDRNTLHQYYAKVAALLVTADTPMKDPVRR